MKFAEVTESEVTRAIVTEFVKVLDSHAETDVIIVGGGPSGLMAGKELAQQGIKVLIIERNNYLGGGFWMGGYLMNPITIRAPAHHLLDELNIPYKEYSKNLYTCTGPHACANLISAACNAGVDILNMTMFDDIVIREKNRVGGVVINWSPISSLPPQLACVDPIALESRVVIDATGHDAVVVKQLECRGLIKTVGCGAMWVEQSEDLVVKHTREVHPGLVAVGMAVSATYGVPRMGPTFGSMLLSGQKGADIAYKLVGKK